MPDREQIISRLEGLKVKPMGFREATDEKIWEANEAGAHFMVTKESLQPMFPLPLTVYALSVSGPYSAKEKIVGDFVKALGIPLEADVNLGEPNPSFILWPISALSKGNRP